MEPVVLVHDAFCLHPLPGGGAVAALRGLSLAVPAGERLVLHGPNGAGKTTLLRVLAGEQRLAAGSATVAGLDVATAAAGELAGWRARQLGQVDQDPGRLLREEFDVLGNVALQLQVGGVRPAAARQRAGEALERLGLASLASRAPVSLSGGQRQRVAVCAALAHGPALVLADEPTGELDLDSADEVYALLDSAVRAAGATLVLVTHDRRAAAIADRVVRIRDGRISETWDPSSGSPGSPGAPDQPVESLVVDERGWLRLPAAVRSRFEDAGEVTVAAVDDAVVLRPANPARVDPAPPPPAPPGDPGDQGVPRRAEPGAQVLGRLSDVRVDYDGRPAVSVRSMTVAGGEVVALTGRSGSGKSTVLRVLLGLQRPTSGTVELAGVDLAGCDRAGLAALRSATCGVVLQQVQLATTADPAGNLDLARAARGLPASPAEAEWLDRLGVGGFAGRPVSGLSGGERQRVALARALGVAPRLLVLDEPSSQLDEAAAEVVGAVLVAAAAAGVAVLVATHDPVLVDAATRRHPLDLET